MYIFLPLSNVYLSSSFYCLTYTLYISSSFYYGNISLFFLFCTCSLPRCSPLFLKSVHLHPSSTLFLYHILAVQFLFFTHSHTVIITLSNAQVPLFWLLVSHLIRYNTYFCTAPPSSCESKSMSGIYIQVLLNPGNWWAIVPDC